MEEEDIGNIWFQQDGATWHTAEATLDVLRPVFKDRIISRRADVVWPPWSCDLTPLDYYLWGAVKDKCHADKPERIDALKDNIREAIGKIKLHTIDNVLKNSTDRVGYCMASRGSHFKIFSSFFLKHFPQKKRYLAYPIQKKAKKNANKMQKK